MADIRNPVGPQAPSSASLTSAVRAPARSEAVRAAQKAFFEAALSGAAPPPALAKPVAASVAPAPSVASAPSLASVKLDTSAAPPTRLLRPGSLVDIKV